LQDLTRPYQANRKTNPTSGCAVFQPHAYASRQVNLADTRPIGPESKRISDCLITGKEQAMGKLNPKRQAQLLEVPKSSRFVHPRSERGWLLTAKNSHRQEILLTG
jgi:hypothetical protein